MSIGGPLYTIKESLVQSLEKMAERIIFYRGWR